MPVYNAFQHLCRYIFIQLIYNDAETDAFGDDDAIDADAADDNDAQTHAHAHDIKYKC